MARLEEEEHYMLCDEVEVEEVVEMSRVRRRGHGNQDQAIADNVLEELEKGPGMHRRYFGLMRKAWGIVEDSLTVLRVVKMPVDSLTVLQDSPTFLDSSVALRDSNDLGDSLDFWKAS